MLTSLHPTLGVSTTSLPGTTAAPPATDNANSSTQGDKDLQNVSSQQTPSSFKFTFDPLFNTLTHNPLPILQQPKTIRARSTSLSLPVDGLLRRNTPLVLPPKKHDPVVRHATQFKQIALRLQKASEVEKVHLFLCNIG